MSIINEALKKASKTNQKIHNEHPTPMPNLPIHIDGKKKDLNWGPFFIVIVLLLITGPIVAPLFSTPFKQGELKSRQADLASSSITDSGKELASLPSISEASTTRKGQFVIEEAPLSMPVHIAQGVSPSPFPHLELTGVVYSASESYCILNGKIVKIGDKIHDAKLVAITSDSVSLERDGQIVILQTNG